MPEHQSTCSEALLASPSLSLRVPARRLLRPLAAISQPGTGWRLLLELVVLAVILGGALMARLENLDDPTDNFDEGAYLSALLLMRHGYRPFAEINTGEGPLNLYLAYQAYALGGYNLEAARTGTALLSLLGIAGVAGAARALGGPVAGLGAALVLTLSPSYLRVSRWVGPEAVAVALVALSVGAAAWAWRTDRDRWRLASGGLLALANLIQASVPMAALAVGLLTVRRSWRAVLAAPLAAGVVVSTVLLAVGPAVVFGRIGGWRLGGRQIEPSWTILTHNAEMLLDKMFRQEQPAFYTLALVGGLVLLWRSRPAGLALLGWLAAQLGLLMAYTELSAHLGVTILPPLAILAGLALAAGGEGVVRARRLAGPALAISVLAAAVGLWYVSAVPALIERDQRLIAGELDEGIGDRESATAVRLIGRLAGADQFVLTDQPYLAFLADRIVPPELVDPSTSRINAGALTADQVLSAVDRYQPPVVVLWTGKLARFPALLERLERDYEVVRSFGTVDDDTPQAVYRRR